MDEKKNFGGRNISKEELLLKNISTIINLILLIYNLFNNKHSTIYTILNDKKKIFKFKFQNWIKNIISNIFFKKHLIINNMKINIEIFLIFVSFFRLIKQHLKKKKKKFEKSCINIIEFTLRVNSIRWLYRGYIILSKKQLRPRL